MNWALADYDFTYPYNQVFQVQSRGIGESCLSYICGVGVNCFVCVWLLLFYLLFAFGGCCWEGGGGWAVGGEGGYSVLCVCTSL